LTKLIRFVLTVRFNYQKPALSDHMIQRRVVVLAVAIVAIIAAAITGYIYLTSLSPNTGGNSRVTVINIPPRSYIVPSGFNTTRFQTDFPTGAYSYPVNITVRIGINNTIEWVNQDTEGHTVTAVVAPSGAPLFNSGLIFPGKTFSVTLTTPGAYRYTCAWHNWLAGQIIVKPA
jgi:plastocyanin